jgi:methylphosphotriester-DNA--protein-cysteine methyltransferase
MTMEKLNQKLMFEAFKNCDNSYDGKFYVCVKTTGIYCLPSCKARLPYKKNIHFVETRNEAIQEGFRGCLRCKSEFFPDVKPKWLNIVKDYLDTAIENKIDENDLVKLALADISTIRRYFKNEYQLTPLAYHRRKRLQHAKDLINNGSNYINAAYETGFESVSGFRDAFYKEFAQTPGELNGNN